MNKFNVSNTLYPYICEILKKERIEYKIFLCCDSKIQIVTSISGCKFHRIVQLAICEKKSADLYWHPPVIPNWVLKDPKLRKKAKEKAKSRGFSGNSFHIINFNN